MVLGNAKAIDAMKVKSNMDSGMFSEFKREQCCAEQ
jgi:hypothetical protein